MLDNSDYSGNSYLLTWLESDEDAGKGEVKVKKEKDPKAPKPPFSAFIMYSMSRRNEMKEKSLRI